MPELSQGRNSKRVQVEQISERSREEVSVVKRFAAVLAWILVVITLNSTNLLAQNKSTPVDQRVKQLHDLLAEQWEYTLKSNPEFASILGDRRYNDKLSDNSEGAIAKDLQQARVFLKRFEAIDTNGFPQQEQLNRDLMVLNLRNRVDSEKSVSYTHLRA